MSYQTGLSGLAASSSNLDVIGNNIANANTVGFKQGSAVFSDLYAGSLASAVGQQIGIGTAMAEVQQQFSQGSITTTNQALNIAINGPGFFMVNQAGSTVYSRNGVFQLDKDGYIVNAQGGQLTGYQANAQGLVQTATAVPLRVPTGNVAPKATQNVTAAFNLNAMDNLMLNTPTAAAGTNTGTGTIGGVTITDPTAGTNADKYTVTFGAGGTTYSVVDSTTGATIVNSATYTSGNPISLGTGQTLTITGAPAAGDTFTVTPNPIAFNPNDGSTYNYSNSIAVYDSLGGSTNFSMYFQRTGAGKWDVYGTYGSPAVSLGKLNTSPVQFDSSGKLISPTTPLTISIPTTDGSNTPIKFGLNLGTTTQYGAKSGVTNLAQDGYTTGQLTGVSISADGTIVGNYSNQQSQALGQIVLANFNNPNGLLNLGGNEFAQTAASGAPQVSAPGSTNHGTLQGGAVEQSNVDLTNSLVNLITAQRNYQANAQTIKTQQAIDQTLINL